MKKPVIVFILFSLFFYEIFASEEENWTVDLSFANINLSACDEKAISPVESKSIAFTTLSFSIGVGYHLNIIPSVFLPGIYIDLGIGYLSLIEGILNDHDQYDDEEENKPFGGWAGIRLYNKFKFSPIDIQPFAGFTIYGWGLPTTTFGILLAYKYYGIEYSFHQPLSDTDKFFNIHRISFVLHSQSSF